MEKLEQRIFSDLMECINGANRGVEENDIRENKFCLGQMDAYLAVLECIGHETAYEYSRKLQYGLHGTYRFERVEKVLVDGKVFFERK